MILIKTFAGNPGLQINLNYKDKKQIQEAFHGVSSNKWQRPKNTTGMGFEWEHEPKNNFMHSKKLTVTWQALK